MTRVYIHGPIPHPTHWVLSPDPLPPPGHLKLAGATIAARTTRSIGADLVSAKSLPSQLDRLLQAFARLDDAGRDEVLHHAEQLAGGR